MSKQHTTVSTEETVAMFELNLKNRVLAAVLAWLVPGLGHLYQGRTAKGLLFMICLVSTFGFGYYIGEGRVAYAAVEDFGSGEASIGDAGGRRGRIFKALGVHWKFICQSGIGGVSIPCLIERARVRDGKEPLLGDTFRPPQMVGFEDLPRHTDGSGNTVVHPNELAMWQYKGGFNFELGTFYTVIAGLLNILVVCDAYSGPLILRPNAPDSQPTEDQAKKGRASR